MKILKKISIAFILIVLILLTSCSSDYPENIINLDTISLDSSSDSYWSTIFENYWNYMNVNYVFWEEELLKNGEKQTTQNIVDWDALYITYSQKFKDLTLSNIYIQFRDDLSSYSGSDLTNKELSIRNTIAMEYFYELQKDLIDHHYTLQFKNIYLDSNNIYLEDANKFTKKPTQNANYYNVMIKQPALIELKSRSSNEYNENYSNLNMSNYILNEFVTDKAIFKDASGNNISAENVKYSYISKDGYTIDNTPFMILSATFGNTAYLYFSSFKIGTYISANPSDLTGNSSIAVIILEFWDYIHDSANNVDKIIFDVRHNKGGNLSDIELLASQLVSINESVSFAKTRTKTGINRLEYSPKVSSNIYGKARFYSNAYENTNKTVNLRENADLIILTDFYSASMSEMLTLMLKAIGGDRTVQIGQRTLGAQGSLVKDYLYSGIVDNSYYYMYTPSTATFDLEGNSFEGVGLTPNIQIDANYLNVEKTVSSNQNVYTSNSSDSVLQRAIIY